MSSVRSRSGSPHHGAASAVHRWLNDELNRDEMINGADHHHHKERRVLRLVQVSRYCDDGDGDGYKDGDGGGDGDGDGDGDSDGGSDGGGDGDGDGDGEGDGYVIVIVIALMFVGIRR